MTDSKQHAQHPQQERIGAGIATGVMDAETGYQLPAEKPWPQSPRSILLSPISECFTSGQVCGINLQDCGNHLQGRGGSLQQYRLEDYYTPYSSSGSRTRAPRASFCQKDAKDLGGEVGGGLPLVGINNSLPLAGTLPCASPGPEEGAVGHQTVHSYSLSLADESDIASAILLQYLAWRVSHADHYPNKSAPQDPYFYETAKALARRYPYLKPKGIDEIIRRLEARELVTVGNYNKLPGDRTRWFSVPMAIRERVLEADDRRHFGIVDAKKYGIKEAIIIFHLESRRETCRIDPVNLRWLATYVGIDRGTLHRKLNKLAKLGVIEKIETPDGNRDYRLVPQPGRRPAFTLPLAVPAPGTSSSPFSAAPTLPLNKAVSRSESSVFKKLVELIQTHDPDPSQDVIAHHIQNARALLGKLDDATFVELAESAKSPDCLLEKIRGASARTNVPLGPREEEILVIWFGADVSASHHRVAANMCQPKAWLNGKVAAIRANRWEEQHQVERKACPTYDQENNADLDAATKAHVLREAIQSYNRFPRKGAAGRPLRLIAGPDDYGAVKRFFEKNLSLTAREVLDSMEAGARFAQLAELPAGSTSDPEHVARVASDLGLFVRYAQWILKVIGRYDLLERLRSESRPLKTRRNERTPASKRRAQNVEPAAAPAESDPWQQYEDALNRGRLQPEPDLDLV